MRPDVALPDRAKHNNRTRRNRVRVYHRPVTEKCDDERGDGGQVAAAAEDRYKWLNLTNPFNVSFLVAEVEHENEPLTALAARKREDARLLVLEHHLSLAAAHTIHRNASPVDSRYRWEFLSVCTRTGNQQEDC